jgi:thiosulfate dehydrogenase [quinone] large subunit
MNKFQETSLFLLRLALGWVLFYAGWEKVTNPSWSAAGYLRAAKTFQGFYAWLATPGMIHTVNWLAEWGLVIIGAALILGIGVRLAGILGAIIMVLFYFPVLNGVYPDANSYLVDIHIVYALALLLIAALGAGKIWQLEGWFKKVFPKGAKAIGVR